MEDINVSAEYLKGFAQSGTVKVLDVNSESATMYETSCSNALPRKWYGKTANGAVYEGHISRSIEKPGFEVVKKIRDTGQIPKHPEALGHLCYYVALQSFNNMKDIDGDEKFWNKSYRFFEILQKAAIYLSDYHDYALVTSDSPINVDPNADSLYFPISHKRVMVFRQPNASHSLVTASRINHLTTKHAERHIIFHPKSSYRK
jgi:hypothetical protein